MGTEINQPEELKNTAYLEKQSSPFVKPQKCLYTFQKAHEYPQYT